MLRSWKGIADFELVGGLLGGDSTRQRTRGALIGRNSSSEDESSGGWIG
jgi:hypothetical protein